MKRSFATLALVLISIGTGIPASAQSCRDLHLVERAEIPSTCQQMTMTMKHDLLDRPYLYVAGKEGGLRIYSLANLQSPALVRTIPITLLENLDVMNLEQSGRYLYLALGNHFTSTQNAGMAVVDLETPASASVLDTWVAAGTGGGAGIITVEGDHAYLGAMKHGLFVIDITNRSDIRSISQFIPDIGYPTPNPNPDLYNARGMAVRDGIVYLCYDAGGLRVINVKDPGHPVETGRYSNPMMNGLARAYNNIVIEDSLAYIAADYCGVEVLNIADTTNIRLHGWWNPYGCPTNNWFSSPVHANEIGLDRDCRLLFVSTGKSDLYVLSVSDPAHPDSCASFGGESDGRGSWGVSIHRDRVFISYVCAVIPFVSNWTGVKILTYDNECLSAVRQSHTDRQLRLIVQGDRLHLENPGVGIESYTVVDILGRMYSARLIESTASTVSIDIAGLPPGMYVLSVQSDGLVWRGKFNLPGS